MRDVNFPGVNRNQIQLQPSWNVFFFHAIVRCFHQIARVITSIVTSIRLSVRSYGKTCLPLDGIPRTMIFQYFWKISRENSTYNKIWQEQRVPYMKTNIHLWSQLAQFFLEWKMFQTKVVEKIKTHILHSVTIFGKRAVYEIT